MKPSPTQSDKTVEQILSPWRKLIENEWGEPDNESTTTDSFYNELTEAIAALTARENRMVQEAVDKWVAHVLENIYPLSVFKKETGGGHIAGIYHGMHILRREVRELSAREDLEPLPQETEAYYTHRSHNDE